MSVLNFEEIKNILPHRYPFLLVDRVIECDDKHIKALKNVSANEPFFMGHFPELALMPGVLQVEAMAQAAGLILAKTNKFNQESMHAFLAAIDQAKFKRMVTPGDQLIIEVLLKAQRASLCKFDATIFVNNVLVSSASLILALRKR
jgi:3-hydroxyacyl-[acyl-carrier-protein] dehydratase